MCTPLEVQKCVLNTVKKKDSNSIKLSVLGAPG